MPLRNPRIQVGDLVRRVKDSYEFPVMPSNRVFLVMKITPGWISLYGQDAYFPVLDWEVVSERRRPSED